MEAAVKDVMEDWPEESREAAQLVVDTYGDPHEMSGSQLVWRGEFLDYRRKKSTPYMEGLRFEPPTSDTADADSPVLSDEDLEQAKREGEAS